MEEEKKTYSRRSFLKVTTISGGGMMIGFSWLMGLKPNEAIASSLKINEEGHVEFNGYIQITTENKIKIFCPNPEFGQNVMTSLPMLIAEELDVDWENCIVEQAPYDTKLYKRQFTGGSNSIRQAWKELRGVGASAREMLLLAAVQSWNVPQSELSTKMGIITHLKSGKSATYGQLASEASKLTPPQNVVLKNNSDFTILGNPQKNVEGIKIVSGKPLFTLDYHQEGMLIAMAQHPPAFGLKLKSFNANEVLKQPGIKEVFAIKVYEDTFEKAIFDTRTFNELVIIVGNSTWEVLRARKKLKATWEPILETKEVVNIFGNKKEEVIPAGLESTDSQYAKMLEESKKTGKLLRKDGNPELAFEQAHQIIERTYTAPFLAHNTMEPISCFADVTDNKALFVAPIQAPDFIAPSIATRLGIPKENIEIQLARMGGGFGRRAYGHYMVEAGIISQKIKAPVKLIYTREDDMTCGIYRPMYSVTYRAAIDTNKKLTALHVKGGGLPESPVHENRFPAGAIDNYLAESWAIPTNLTIGAFRAPRSNFIASAEQSFLDELAEALEKDPIDFRIELLQRAKENPVGKNNEYNADRYLGVLEMVKDKSDWKNLKLSNKKYGVAAYFCHQSYAAHVVELTLNEGIPVVEKVTTAIDCGVVVNPEGAKNMIEGAVVDGIGNSLFGALTVTKGKPDQQNFDQYRMIRHNEAPKNIDIHFVKNNIDPTGLGEPPFPPVFAAVANALYKAAGKRFYNQPFQKDLEA
nr:molybdopterin cofactor-binding domain-containing protein [uncultured Flavobacterium sp.]